MYAMLPISSILKVGKPEGASTSLIDLTGSDSEDENKRMKEVIDIVSGDDTSDSEYTAQYMNGKSKSGELRPFDFLGKKEPIMDESGSEKDEALPNQIFSEEDKPLNEASRSLGDTKCTEQEQESMNCSLDHENGFSDSAIKVLKKSSNDDLEDGEIPEAQKVRLTVECAKEASGNIVANTTTEGKDEVQKRDQHPESNPHRYMPVPRGLLHVPNTAPRRHWNPRPSTMRPFVPTNNLQCLNRPVPRPLFGRRPNYDCDPGVLGSIPFSTVLDTPLSHIAPFAHGPFINGSMNHVNHPRNVPRMHLHHPILGKRVRTRKQSTPSSLKRTQTRPITNEVDIEKLRDAALRTKRKEKNDLKVANTVVESPNISSVKPPVPSQEASLPITADGQEADQKGTEKASLEDAEKATASATKTKTPENPVLSKITKQQEESGNDKKLRPLTAHSQTVIIHLSQKDLQSTQNSQISSERSDPPSLKTTTTSNPIDQATTINAAIQAMKQKIAEREMKLQCAEQKRDLMQSKHDTSLSYSDKEAAPYKETVLSKKKEILGVEKPKIPIKDIKTIEECEQAIVLCKYQYSETDQKLADLDEEICQIEALLHKV